MARPGGDLTKQRILEAVVQAIIEVGYTDMTIADVADRAKVSNPLVHYHFSSKADLIAAALQVASEDDQRFRDEIVHGDGSVAERLDHVLCGSLPIGSDDGSWLLWIETWGETRRDPDIRQVMSELHDHELAAVAGLIREGVAAGEFRCDDESATAARLTAVRDGLAIDRTLFHTDQSDESLFAQMRRAIANDIGESGDRSATLVRSGRTTIVR